MSNKPTVTIGIPAYNEEANIKKLLESLLAQKQETFELKEIIVVSDGSSDQTVELAKSVGNEKVVVVDSKENKGLGERQNEIVSMFIEGVLVILNADILPENLSFIEKLVEPIVKDPSVGLVSGKGTPVKAESFFESILNYSVQIRDSMAEAWHGGDNVYNCHGHSRAFSEKFAKEIHWTHSVGEDAFSYLSAKEKGYKFVYQNDARVLYRSPQNLKDHYKQSIRFANSQQTIQQLFPSINVAEEYRIPLNILLTHSIKFFIKNPILFVSYIIVQMVRALNPYKVTNSANWEPSQTSKKL